MNPTRGRAVLVGLLLSGCGASVGPQGTTDGGTDVVTTSDASATDAAASADVAAPPADALIIPGHCFPYEPADVIAPSVLLTGQALGFTATVRGGTLSCGATPLLSGSPEQLSWTLSACGGCEACDCIDPGYQYAEQDPAPAAGSHTLRIGASMHPLRVFPPEACVPAQFAPADGVGVEIVGPDPSLRRVGPGLWWAHITGHEPRCCGEPTLGATVAMIRPDNADLAVMLTECQPDDCECAGTPHAFDTWVNLGELPPGNHGLRVSGAPSVVSFTVPAGP